MTVTIKFWKSHEFDGEDKDIVYETFNVTKENV